MAKTLPESTPENENDKLSRRSFLIKSLPTAAVAAMAVVGGAESAEGAEQKEIQNVFDTIVFIEKYRARFNQIDEKRFQKISTKDKNEMITSLTEFAQGEYKKGSNITPFPKRTGETREDLNAIINFICTEYTLGCVETIKNGKKFGSTKNAMNHLEKLIFVPFEKNLIEWGLIN